MDNKKKDKLFQDIGEIVQAENEEDNRPTEIESYCVNCEKNGITKLLLTRIPHWRDIVIMSFECEHCGLSNNEVQFAGAFAEKGCAYTCDIDNKEDLNRQLVKSETATVIIPELELEIPSTTKKGRLTTIEGLVTSIIEDLSTNQPVRKHTEVGVYNKIENIIQKLSDYLENKEKFSVTVDDPAGNSYIENLCVPNPDPKLHIRHFNRTREMNIELGLKVPDEISNNNNLKSNNDLDKHKSEKGKEEMEEMEKKENDDDDVQNIMIFPANCSHCNTPCDTKMHVLNIPHFREVIIMSTVCDNCGYKSNEVKTNGGIPPTGKKITLLMETIDDLSRDILKSETCGLSIPELDLELQSGTLGGRFTTIEGLLRQVYDELIERVPFVNRDGDSVQDKRRETFKNFLEKLDKVIGGEVLPAHIILDDPLSNSYLQNPYAPESDPNMKIEIYKRSWEQNEFLGLNDIVLENYGSTP
ncbi:hypothetical protein Glove_26g106 [Diversispora epigaea]|uniref:Zinc finger ZPR1-type domain-containing protein n=1 Tax=Diversispora epigaea TaxID=1348612 RepID=A0A397JI33_9GLOM|nr:hypothetical protein Glove_26g106 [Diversispora epigaea]